MLSRNPKLKKSGDSSDFATTTTFQTHSQECWEKFTDAIMEQCQECMHSEIALLRRKQMTVEEQVQKAPAKLDPNTSLRRLSITDKNLASYNALFALGNIRQD